MSATATGNRIPQELIDRPQWVVWRNVQRGTETAKLPFQPNGRAAKTNDASTWSTFEICNRAWACGEKWDGVGFVFAADDGMIGVDLDGCRDPQTGDMAAWTTEIIEQFNSYAEISPSQTGVKIFVQAEWPFDRGRKCNVSATAVCEKRPGIEVYAEKRYFTVTGQRLDEVSPAVEERQSALDWLIGRYFPDKAAGNGRAHSNGRAAGDVLDRARKYLTKVPGAVSGERGHDATFHVACVLVCDFALSTDDAFALLAEWNRTCEPPWTEQELRHKIESASKQPGERGRLRDAEPQRRNNGRRADPEPNSKQPDPLSVKHVGNADLIKNEDGEKIVIPRPMNQIVADIRNLASDWPRRVGSALFVHEGDAGIEWVSNASSLYGYLGAKSDEPPRFLKVPSCHSKGEVYERLRQTATNYEAVEEWPHHPKIDGIYYASGDVKPGNGDALRRLVDRFTPETDIDRDLILSMIVTLFWGGAGGTRPAFLLTADEGRGVGKTKLAQLVAYITGGAIELSANEDGQAIKQRLLSPDGITKRVALLDNVKSNRFSSADLESFITSPVISGKRMYVGEGRRPNLLTWVITLNGASLSTDVAQRCVIVKLARPKYQATWEEQARKYVDDHRQQIIADCIGFLQSEPTDLKQYSRWGAWESDVLSRLPEPAEAQAVIAERQGSVDAETEESDLITDHFRQALQKLDYNTEFERVFISSSVAAEWLNEATRERHNVTAASRMIRQKIGEHSLPNLTENKCKIWGRGFVWIGNHAAVDGHVLTDLEARIGEQKNRERTG